MNLLPARRQPAAPDKPQPITPAGITLPPMQHPSQRPPAPNGYLRVGRGDGLDSRVPAPRHAELPPPDQVRRHDPALADLITEHPGYQARYSQAVDAVDNQTGYRAALDTDRQAVEAGTPPEPFQSAAAGWLYARHARIAAAAIAAMQVDHHLDLIVAAATASTALREGSEKELDQWIAGAVARTKTAIRNSDRAELHTIEQEARTVYWPRRGLWQWAVAPGHPYQPRRSALPRPLANVIFENNAAITALLGNYHGGIYSQIVVNQLAEGGDL